jgi:hypothetical protein
VDLDRKISENFSLRILKQVLTAILFAGFLINIEMLIDEAEIAHV